MSWPLLKPRENSEDDDSDFNVSTDEEDNRLRQEYNMNRTRIPEKQQFELLNCLISVRAFAQKSFVIQFFASG